jgi:pimeloyl-ACP methyl ester carboxylesterase
LTADYPEKKKKWSLLGQSYGGFISTTYLSTFPGSLKEVFMTGGIPPLTNNPDEVYKNTYSECCDQSLHMIIANLVANYRAVEKVEERNKAYYAKFPSDIKNVWYIIDHLFKEPVKLPSGGVLSARRFMMLGINFGAHGMVDAVHGKLGTLAFPRKYS